VKKLNISEVAKDLRTIASLWPMLAPGCVKAAILIESQQKELVFHNHRCEASHNEGRLGMPHGDCKCEICKPFYAQLESQQKEIDCLETAFEHKCEELEMVRDGAFVDALKEIEELRKTIPDSSIRAALEAKDMEIAELKSKYMELIFAVARKFPNESRHQTALRYIEETESRCESTDAAMQETKLKQ